jgi:hypothetical protein
VVGILGAAIVIAFVGFLFYRRRRGALRTESEPIHTNGNTKARGKYALWQNNEKLFPQGINNEFGQPRAATPASEIVTVAGPEYHSLPYSTLPRS